MGLFSVFDNYANDRKKSHLKNLIEIALADGTFDEQEKALIKEIAIKLELSEKDIEEIRKKPESVKFTPPSSEKLKIEQLNELVKLMIVDKKIDEKEVSVCKNMAIKLNLAPNIIDDLIEMNIKKGK